MGYFHDGHLSLMRRARAENEVVVVSLFVNPAQFGPSEDLDAYPRDEERDARAGRGRGRGRAVRAAGRGGLPGGFATTVTWAGSPRCSRATRSRRGPGHFAGVTTVVTKLLNMVRPDAAYFGQKDAQQALVISKLVRDLDIPVRIEVCPTIRDADGLALSSRNAYLSEPEERQALALSRALRAAEAAVEAGELDADAVLRAARAELDEAGIEPEYLELRSTTDFPPSSA